jgi:hypothetical protein
MRIGHATPTSLLSSGGNHVSVYDGRAEEKELWVTPKIGDKHRMMIKIRYAWRAITSASLVRYRELTCSRCGSSRLIEADDGARIVNRVGLEEWLFGEREPSR